VHLIEKTVTFEFQMSISFLHNISPLLYSSVFHLFYCLVIRNVFPFNVIWPMTGQKLNGMHKVWSSFQWTKRSEAHSLRYKSRPRLSFFKSSPAIVFATLELFSSNYTGLILLLQHKTIKMTLLLIYFSVRNFELNTDFFIPVTSLHWTIITKSLRSCPLLPL